MRLDINDKSKAWARIGYVPNAAAVPAHSCENRIVMVAGGERAGKSKSASAEAIPHALLVSQPLGWVVGPTYDLARPEFEYILDGLSKLGAVADASFPRQGPCTLKTIVGTEIVTRSADDPVKLAAKAPDWVLMCEAAQCSLDVFYRLRGRVAERRGWMWLSGTFESSLGWYADYWQRWQAENPEGAHSFSLPTWSNTAIFPLGEQDPEILALKRTYSEDQFNERCGAVPCKPTDVVIKEFDYSLHVGKPEKPCEYDPALPVELWIDPGYSGSGGSYYAVEAVQYPNYRDVNVIDEIYADHATTQEVIAAAKTKAWWGKVKGGVIDVAAKAHAAMPSVWQTWNDAGIGLRCKPVPIPDGIEVHRVILKPPDGSAPRIRFNPNCRGAFREYGAWRRKKVGELLTDPQTTNCDAMKAIQYGLVDRFGLIGAERKARAEAVPGWSWSGILNSKT